MSRRKTPISAEKRRVSAAGGRVNARTGMDGLGFSRSRKRSKKSRAGGKALLWVLYLPRQVKVPRLMKEPAGEARPAPVTATP